MKILVIADDLTGALDTGVQFTARGIMAKVIVDGQYWEKNTDDKTQALILDLETRCRDGKTAYELVKAAAEEACQNGVDFIYKKTDSVQRGNIGYELQAVLDGAGQRQLHYAPAFPQMGRITRDGIHYVNDVPVADTVFGKDPYEPVKYSYIPDIIHEQSGVNVSIQKTGEVCSADGICLYDAASPQELEELAGKLVKSRAGKEVTLVAGCAGFALALSAVLGRGMTESREPVSKEKFLVVAGSMNPITGHQLTYAVKYGFAHIRLKREQLERKYWETEESRIVLENFRKIYEENNRIILDTYDTAANSTAMKAVGEKAKKRIRREIAESLGIIVCALLKDMSGTALMVVGGDTLTGLMRQMRVQELVPVCEVFQGVVCSEFQKEGKTVRMLSKSGGFGEKELLVRLADMLL